MSMPLTQQPPAVTVAQEPFSTHSTHGSIGPLIVVLVVIMILGVLAVMIGRLCSGRRILGYGQYDIESWAETKCASCIDGRISSPAPRSNPFVTSGSSPLPVQIHQETKQEEQSPQHPPESL
ncbi:uncharacterized protein LOC8260874 [Ricinus communis]|uniref:Uncharacterized protein n=1 Tax=Ricinus communis TaxID=3988 RepID=B9R7I2_RICCO|nr:uncharacterized protein LOC8260874 [Ricinus communis]EEF52462.1 conserved hypothetical protein [Ricinus communis]|eukprot:XP_002510275.1 uncharacterized protein LOC8260874 [Ricinus communis]